MEMVTRALCYVLKVPNGGTDADCIQIKSVNANTKQKYASYLKFSTVHQ
nr:hypothetical protein [Vibrio cholerae]